MTISVKQVAAAIVPLLAGEWRKVGDDDCGDHWCQYERADGLRLHFGSGRYNEKKPVISCSVSPPNSPAGQRRDWRDWNVLEYKNSSFEQAPSAKMDRAKPADVLAKEITRRVLEPTAPLMAKVREKASAEMARQASGAALLQRVARVLGGEEPNAKDVEKGEGSFSLYGKFAGVSSGYINVSHSGAHLERLYMDADTIVAFVEWLKSRGPYVESSDD
jgi:hypothetical protein